MTRLPGAEVALVEERKVRTYLLDPDHPQNGGKAAFFQRFGFDAARWGVMQDALARHPVTNSVAEHSISPHGAKYLVRCSIMTPDGRNPCITSIWIQDDAAGPRLVTAFPG